MSMVEPSVQTEFSELVEALIKEMPASYWAVELKNLTAGRRILKLTGAEQGRLLFYLISLRGRERGPYEAIVNNTIIELLRKQIPFTYDQIVWLVKWFTLNEFFRWRCYSSLVKKIEYYLAREPLTPELHESILRLLQESKSDFNARNLRHEIRALEKLVTEKFNQPLAAGEAWSDQAIAEIAALPDTLRRQWGEFLNHMQDANKGGAPTAKWQKTAETLLEPIGYDLFRQCLLRWIPLVDKPRTAPLRGHHLYADTNPNDLLSDGNADILRAMIWLCYGREDAEVARALTMLALSTYRKVRGIGPRCIRVGNACVWALGKMPGRVGIYQLALLQVKVKFGTAQKGIEKALTAAAEREGLPRDEIEELAMPTYGLTAVGSQREQFGEYSAELRVTGTHSVELKWFKPDGKEQRAIPKTLKTVFAEEIKELQQAAKDIQTMLPVQSERIDRLYLQRKSWEYPIWRERYLDHPLVGILARRLIWRFTDGDATTNAIWHNEQLVDASGQALQAFGPQTRVELWHPIVATQDEIVAWRSWLEQNQVQQPFKQAHRELYLLTDAERQTQTYSNRFAAHILRQHQFNGLCAVRGWRNKLRLMVDDTYPPAMKDLPEWGLRAEYWIEGAGDTYGADTNEIGTYLRVVTDQVRFYPIDAALHRAHADGGGYGTDRYAGALYGIRNPQEALSLDEIPLLVFSEIMRDVDLFVGVASVGNDPTWSDGGPNGHYQEYWTNYSFGDLSETAKTRKSVLATLLPRLKIASRCTLQDRFLVVRGKLRTYKIHLGSSNIQMEPNNQYLCIVPNRRQSEDDSSPVFLPFEGDRTLALILSKAFLLADDTSITDTTILRQIRG